MSAVMSDSRQVTNMPVIIDGYNLLYAIAAVGEEYQSFSEEDLCRSISEYLVKVRDRGAVVFDGTGPPDKDGLGGLKNMEVYFSGPHTDADTIIEEKILDNTAPKSLIVISSDRRLKDAARKRKAVSIPSDVFWRMLIQELDKKVPTPEPKEKRHIITEHETHQRMTLFDIDDD